LSAPLEEGTRFPLTVTFERAGSIEVQVMVHAAGALEPGHGQGAGGKHDPGS
jgi:copper(I)-binding protein